MSEKKKRNIIIGALCTVLLLMVVGYAAFNSVLKIKGTSNINSNWDIKITSITSDVLHGNPTNAKEPEGVGTLTASFETNLVSPGDSIKYTITVANQGNINAKLDKITISEPDNQYVTFETSGLTEGDSLNAGSTADLKVIVTFKDVEINKMDKSTSKLTVTLDYSQADGNGGTAGGNFLTIEDLIATKITTGDGLYADEYEAGRYVYKGANPNNYITFNNETWRIISVETDGTLKIMKKESIGDKWWDTSGSSNWARPATLNTYLNGDYYNTLSEEAKGLIQTHTWGIGGVTYNNTDLAAQIASENSTTWTGNIGLIAASDAIRANTNTEQCGNYSLNTSNVDICKTTNYIVPTARYSWTISPYASSSTLVFFVNSYGSVYYRNANSGNSLSSGDVLPVLYLTPNITLKGEGTESNPYRVAS